MGLASLGWASLSSSLNLFGRGRAVRIDERNLACFNVQLAGLPQEHAAFILDAIAARANYCITNRQAWLDLSEETERSNALQIVSPGRFVELEG